MALSLGAFPTMSKGPAPSPPGPERGPVREAAAGVLAEAHTDDYETTPSPQLTHRFVFPLITRFNTCHCFCLAGNFASNYARLLPAPQLREDRTPNTPPLLLTPVGYNYTRPPSPPSGAVAFRRWAFLMMPPMPYFQDCYPPRHWPPPNSSTAADASTRRAGNTRHPGLHLRPSTYPPPSGVPATRPRGRRPEYRAPSITRPSRTSMPGHSPSPRSTSKSPFGSRPLAPTRQAGCVQAYRGSENGPGPGPRHGPRAM